MKDVVMGTAGHIDHGKTALIKALTGTDCDTHPLEKARGITINLGFSHIENADTSIGIIDVPGHRDFINTMVSGAFGIDFVILVVAADEGIMPQTEEHLKIMELLGVSEGICVITKTDLVDSEILEFAESEIIGFTKGTFLEKAPVVLVSSFTGEGIQELKNHIFALANSIPPKGSRSFYRMYIDRIFSVKGFGTVAAGTSLGGCIKEEDIVYLVPGGKNLKIRRIEKYGLPAKYAGAGSRVSVNVSGLQKEEFKRGMVISEKIIVPSDMIDAELHIIHQRKKYPVWFNVIFLSGTFSSSARVHLLDKNTVEADAAVLVQIHLDHPAPVVKADRFIVRNSSGEYTIGGGKIIDVYPLHHKRRPPELIEKLQALIPGDIQEFIWSELNKKRLLLSVSTLSQILFLGETEILNSARELPSGILFIQKDSKAYFVLRKSVEKYGNKVLRSLENYHKKNPLSESGKSGDELVSIFADFAQTEGKIFLDILLEDLIKKRLIRSERNTFVLYSHNVVVSGSLNAEIELVKKYFKQSGMHTPLPSEYIPLFEKNGISGVKIKQILSLLISNRILVVVEGSVIYSGIVDDCRIKLLRHLNENRKGITVAEFRDLTGGNRKICLLLLNYFDGEGITIRDGDYRNLTEKGKIQCRPQA